MYKVIFYSSKTIEKDKKNLKKNLKDFQKIINKINILSKDPFNSFLDIKKLQKSNEEGIFRMRVGNYRIVYDIDTSNKIILIYRIKQRKEGYE